MSCFEKYINTGRKFKPTISIRKTGLFSIGVAAYKQFNITEFSYAELYYDKENKAVGILPIQAAAIENNESLIQIRRRTSGADISAKRFLACFNIKHDETTQYPAQRDDMTGMIVFSLKCAIKKGE